MDKINMLKSLVQDVQAGIKKVEIIEFATAECFSSVVFRSLYRRGLLPQVTGRQDWSGSRA